MSRRVGFAFYEFLFFFLFIIIMLSFCKLEEKKGISERKEFFGESSFYIGSAPYDYPKFYISGENIYIGYKNSENKIEFVTFSFPKSISKYELFEEGELKGILPGGIIIDRGSKVFIKDVVTGNENKLFDKYSDVYYVLSPTEFAYFDGNSIIISYGQNRRMIKATLVEEIKLIKVNERIFTFYKTLIEGKKIILWTEGEKSGVLGRYKEKKKLNFYPQEGSFVAFLDKPTFGAMENLKLYVNGNEISNFSLGVTYSWFFVSLEDFPEGEVIAEYDIVPEFDQVEFDVTFNGTDIFFVVFEQVYEGLLGKVFYGRFDGENFRKLDAFEFSSINKVFLSSKNNFLAVSLLETYVSRLFVFTVAENHNIIIKSVEFDDVKVFPIILENLPYVFLIEKRGKDLFLSTYALWQI